MSTERLGRIVPKNIEPSLEVLATQSPTVCGLKLGDWPIESLVDAGVTRMQSFKHDVANPSSYWTPDEIMRRELGIHQTRADLIRAIFLSNLTLHDKLIQLRSINS
ncbi:hypothetical protein HY025_02840 [Candidatus Daviesbacteria bacterium]|nr:hypothetical protein [Candidatus Daviesbacteria bacterium]